MNDPNRKPKENQKIWLYHKNNKTYKGYFKNNSYQLSFTTVDINKIKGWKSRKEND